MTNYTVQAGDTLSKIAKAHGTTVSELAKQNGITDINKIEIGQELSFGKTTASAPQTAEQEKIGLDSFEKKSTQKSNELSPLAYATGGAVAYGVGSKVLPKAASETRTLYASAKTGTKKAYAKMKATAKHNAKAVRTFVAQKAKHAAKSAELHYAFGKDAVQKGVKSAVKKAKVGGRYTRFIANTKVAPKLIKGASRYAGPLAAVYGMYEVKTAYDKGGERAAVRQAVKTGGGLAGGWAGAKVGAAIGSIAGPIGTVIGGIAGGILGYCLGEKLCS